MNNDEIKQNSQKLEQILSDGKGHPEEELKYLLAEDALKESLKDLFRRGLIFRCKDGNLMYNKKAGENYVLKSDKFASDSQIARFEDSEFLKEVTINNKQFVISKSSSENFATVEYKDKICCFVRYASSSVAPWVDEEGAKRILLCINKHQPDEETGEMTSIFGWHKNNETKQVSFLGEFTMREITGGIIYNVIQIVKEATRASCQFATPSKKIGFIQKVLNETMNLGFGILKIFKRKGEETCQILLDDQVIGEGAFFSLGKGAYSTSVKFASKEWHSANWKKANSIIESVGLVMVGQTSPEEFKNNPFKNI